MKIIIIGSSTGGPYILEEIFSGFPLIEACIIIIQHLPISFTETFRKSISLLTKMKVVTGAEGSQLENRTIVIAPAGKHMILEDNRRIHLDDGMKIHGVKPAADITMCSLVKRSDDRLAGVVLTGMGRDGTGGLIHIHNLGGVTMVQDPKTAPIQSMPLSAIESGSVRFVYIPSRIREALINF